MENPWKTHSKTTVYDNPWISVAHHEVTTPGHTPGIYGLVHFKNLAIGVIPLDELGNTWLVGQYRYPLNRYSWEIPEGGGPFDTDPLVSAQRELREETGMTASQWDKLLEVDLSNSVSDETGILFLARDLQKGPAEPEETELLQLKKLPIREAISMVLKGEITDSLSMIGLLYIDHLLREGKL